MMTHLVVTLLASSLSSSQCPYLMAFLQLLPLAVSSVDPLPDPTLSTDPAHPFYYEGERLAVECAAPTPNITGYRFFNQSGEEIYRRAPYSLPTAKLQLTATEASAGLYTCMYFVDRSGREIPSNRSLPLAVIVLVAPTAPTLSLDPQQKDYRPGSFVKLVCSIPSIPEPVRQIQYYADFGLAVSIPVSNVKSYSYDLRITGEEASESYSCAYFVIRSGRPVHSNRSPWINIHVKSHKISWVREILVGGSFFTINGLIFFFSHHLMKRRGVEEGFQTDQ